MIDPDTPEILRQFLAYHETIKGQSPKTIDEYHLDLRMFLRFLVLMRSEMPIDTDLETISVRHVDVEFLRSVTTNDIFDFLSYLARERRTQDGSGLGASARARKLSAIKSFFKYLTTRTKLLDENPAQDIEYPRMRPCAAEVSDARGKPPSAGRGRRAEPGTRLCDPDAVSELRHPPRGAGRSESK